MEELGDVIEEHMRCPVCHEIYIDPVELSCQHIYCSMCASAWVSKSNTCPMCRADVRERPDKLRHVTADKLLDHVGKLLSKETQERRRAAKRLREEDEEEKKRASQSKKMRKASYAMAASLFVSAASWIFKSWRPSIE